MKIGYVDPERSHYQVLGVAPDAALEEIRVAHRHLVLSLHPDRHAGESESERALAARRIREVNEAWAVLSDHESRLEYDRILDQLEAAATASCVQADGTARADRRSSGEHLESAPHDHSPEPPAEETDLYRRTFPRDATTNAVFYDAVDAGDTAAATRMSIGSRGVIVAVLFLAFLIFVFTAYAGSVKDSENKTVPSTTAQSRQPVGGG